RLLAPPLVEPAVEQDLVVAGLQQVHGAGDAAGRAPEGERGVGGGGRGGRFHPVILTGRARNLKVRCELHRPDPSSRRFRSEKLAARKRCRRASPCGRWERAELATRAAARRSNNLPESAR